MKSVLAALPTTSSPALSHRSKTVKRAVQLQMALINHSVGYP